MKKALACVVVLVMAGQACAAAGANLVPNGGFEELKQSDFLAALPPATREFYGGTADSPFQGWAFGGRWEGGDYAVAVSDDAHSGQRSCQITCNRKGRGGIASSPFALRPGTVIRISFWMKAKDAVGGRIFLNFEGSPGDGWDSKDLPTGTFDWTRFTKRAVVPAPKSGGDQTLAVFLYSKAEGSVWIDDFAVETVEPGAADDSAGRARAPGPIAEPADSIGYRVSVVPALQKVFRPDDFAPTVCTRAEVSSARNEYESVQVVVEAPWRAVKIKDVHLSDLAGPGGAAIPASALRWDRVGYVETTAEPPYYAARGLGAYPDPLMPPGEFVVEKLSRAAVWITIRTPRDAPAGPYSGTITIVPEGLKPAIVPLALKVWDFALPDETHLRTLTWLGTGLLRVWYGNDWSAEGERRHAEVVRNYEDFLLEHRLGPGGEVAAHVAKDKTGRFNFAPVDAHLERLVGRGMNAFLMGTAPNLRREGKKEYTPEFVRDFSEMIRAYAGHLREKGWLKMAYVYTYDEAPREAWPEVRKIAAAVKAAAPDVRPLQCLNQPEGVQALADCIDVFDVYIAQYHKAGVAALQKRGTEVWLAVCCYPMDHPNFFLEYPLADARLVPWFSWKYGAAGFEYWSPNAWGANTKRPEKWPRTPWVANAFGRYNGDGYLVYPGADGKPYSSLRFEALRDGLEDYEYLWMLRALAKEAEAAGRTGPALDDAKRLLALEGVLTDAGGYAPEGERLAAFREKAAGAILALQAQGGPTSPRR